MADIENTISPKRLKALQQAADTLGLTVKDLLALSKDGPVFGEDIPPKVSPEFRIEDTSRKDFSLLGDPGNKANLPAVLEKQPASNVPPKVPGEFAKEIVDEGKHLGALRGGGGLNLPAVIKAETPAIEESVAAATKGLSGKTKALAAAGAGIVAGVTYLANRNQQPPAASTSTPIYPTPSGKNVAPSETPPGPPAPPSVSPVDKATTLLEEQARFKQLQNMFASMVPSGNLSEKQVANISKKYDDEATKIAAELAEAKQEYQAGRDRIQNAALIDSLGKGLAQLMAGLYGVNTGRDAVTGVDFKPKDWSSSFSQLQRDYAQKASELKDLRKEGESKKEQELSFAERQAARAAQQSGAAVRGAFQEVSEEKRQAATEARGEQRLAQAEEREAAKAQKEKQKLIDTARAELEGLKQVLRTGDTKTKKKQEEVVAETLGKAGVPTSKIKAALEEYKGGIFEKDKPEVLDELLQDLAPTQTTSTAEKQMVTVTVKATGESRQFPANSPQAINARKNPAFEVK